MKFEVKATLVYDVWAPTTIILNVHAQQSVNQLLLTENFSIQPTLAYTQFSAGWGENRFVRFEVPEAMQVGVNYQALIDVRHEVVDLTHVVETPVAVLPPHIIPYLYPSRYCQSDKMYRLAVKKFGHLSHPFDKVLALSDWIFHNVDYLSGYTTVQTSAYDTVAEQAGVCRDFAHLAIAFCRALNIPARYFSSYAYQLNPPDFHACFEAYIGHRWILFDASNLVSVNSLIKIATGMDAADTAIASIFGNLSFNLIDVNCQTAEDGFEPFYYQQGYYQALSLS